MKRDSIWEKAPQRRRATITQLVGGNFNLGLTVLQGLLLVPLYLQYLGPRLYGLWIASGGILAWLTSLDMGLGSLMIQRISSAYGQKDGRGISLYFFNGLLLQFLLVGLLVGSAAVIAPWVPVWFNATSSEVAPLRGCFILAAVAMAFSIVNDGAASLSQSFQRPLFMIVATAACTFVGLLTTIALLLGNWGLWAIPSGLLARNILLFSGNLIYSLWLVIRIDGKLRYNKAVMLDMIKLSPALFASKFGFGLVGNIEPTLITLMLQPEMAAAFAITKRAVDIIKLVLDRIAGAVFSGFSHLYGEGEVRKAADVAGLVMTLLFSTGLICMGAYIAGNASFVGLWVGASHFAGQEVTVLLAISVFITVTSNLISYLLGATGDIATPSLLNFAEAIFRVVLMALLLSSLGLVGLPLATIISSSLVTLLFYKRFVRRLSLSIPQFTKLLQALCMLIVIGGSAVAFQHLIKCTQWWQLIITIFGFVTICGAFLLVNYYPFFMEIITILKQQKK